MKLTDIELGTMEYIQQEIATKTTGYMKFLIYTGTFLGAGMIEQAINKYSEILKAMQIMDNEGNIDIEKLYNASKQGIKESGSFEFKGIIFDEKDVDKLYTFIKKREVLQ